MTKKKPNITIEVIKRAVQTVVEKNKIHPRQITIAQLTKVNPDITAWTIRLVGGLETIKNLFPLEDKEYVSIKRSKDVTTHVKTLESKLMSKLSLEQDFIESIRQHIQPLKVQSFKVKKSKKQLAQRHVVAMLNDTHYGLTVKPEEVANTNEYNWTIASRRTAMFIDEIVHFKQDKRNDVEMLHFLINGDIIAGIIHNLMGRDNDLLVHQFNGAVHILTHAIARLAETYPQLTVYFSSGNHGEAPHRREGGRTSSQVFDTFESMIFYALSVAHRDTKNVKFIATSGLFQEFILPAGRAMFTHGHLLFSKTLGNPGTIINTKGLSDTILRFNNGEELKGKQKFKLILTGHTHSFMHIRTPDNVQVYNAPSLSGVDSYAHYLGINHNFVGQVVFESTDKYIFGDSRLVILNEADNNGNLDSLIPVYNYKLTHNEE